MTTAEDPHGLMREADRPGVNDRCAIDAQGRPTYRFDHHAGGFARDPWSVYREIREGCPVAWSDTYDDGFWVVSRYADVASVAMDDATFSSDREVVLPATKVGRIIPLNSDPPDLTRYRHLLNRW